MLDKAISAARAGRDSALQDLLEELRIQSISTLPEHHDECLRNANWLVDKFRTLGFEAKLVDTVAGGNPVLHAEWMGVPGAPVFTIYGHYDVQPVDPLNEWESPPFEPEIKEGWLFARGCADNKGNHMSALKAAEYWMGSGGPPVNLRFLIEGEEEIGGRSLPTYLRESAGQLKTDHVLLWDGGFSVDDRPSLTVGLRGLVGLDIDVQGPSRDVHSGGFGGVTPNPCNELARIIAALKDDNGRITVPGFYDDVVDAAPEEKARWHRPTEADLLAVTGTKRLVGEEGPDIAERLWVRPTLDVIGIIGGFTGEGSKTIIPARCHAKLSCRLVPNQDPDTILDLLEKHIVALAGDAVSISTTRRGMAAPISLGYEHAGVQAADRAFKESFGRDAVLVRSGGSIPVALDFQEALDAPIVTSGIASADSRVHSPNERLQIENYHLGTEMLIRLMQYLSET